MPVSNNKCLSSQNESNCSLTSECVRTDLILPRGAGLEHGRCKQSIFSLSTRSAGDEAWRRGENGLKKFARSMISYFFAWFCASNFFRPAALHTHFLRGATLHPPLTVLSSACWSNGLASSPCAGPRNRPKSGCCGPAEATYKLFSRQWRKKKVTSGSFPLSCGLSWHNATIFLIKLSS